MQVAQRRVSRSEVIQAQSDSQSLDPFQHQRRGIDILDDRALGNFDLQAARIESGLGEDLRDAINKIGLRELFARQIDTDAERRIRWKLLLPCAKLLARLTKNPLSDLNDQTGLFRNRNELERRDVTVFWML